jgi:hypothetical protein
MCAMKLQPDQREIVRLFAVGVKSTPLNHWNDYFAPLLTMVLGLRNCQLLGSSDVLHFAIDHAVDENFVVNNGVHDSSEESIELLATSLISFIESMPRACQLRISLPAFPNWGSFSISLAPGVKIVSNMSDDAVKTLRPLNELASRLLQPPFVVGGASLLLDVRGAAGSSADSASVSAGLSLAKLCSFLLLNTEALTLGVFQNPASAVITDTASDKAIKVGLPQKLAQHFGGVVPNQDRIKVLDSSKSLTLLGAVEREADTNEERITAFKELLSPASKIIRLHKNKKFSPLSTAIEWYQDSVLSEDQTMAYIAACIGLESIFGEKDMNEISKRLEDRYAFLLGTDREHRKQLARDYGEVLRIRGQLIHARAKKLGQRDFNALKAAREMLRKSILHELKAFMS